MPALQTTAPGQPGAVFLWGRHPGWPVVAQASSLHVEGRSGGENAGKMPEFAGCEPGVGNDLWPRPGWEGGDGHRPLVSGAASPRPEAASKPTPQSRQDASGKAGWKPTPQSRQDASGKAGWKPTPQSRQDASGKAGWKPTHKAGKMLRKGRLEAYPQGRQDARVRGLEAHATTITAQGDPDGELPRPAEVETGAQFRLTSLTPRRRCPRIRSWSGPAIQDGAGHRVIVASRRTRHARQSTTKETE